MPAIMLPYVRTFDPEAVDGLLSIFTRLPGHIPVALLAPLAEDGMGRATVDGVPLSGCEEIDVYGRVRLLIVPVGEVAREHGRSYRVVLEGFRARNGRRFPRCSFRVRTTPRRERDPRYDAHDARALEVAREGMVLLKNDGDALPLPPDAWLNCLGTGQHSFRISATGASRINPRWRPGFHRAVAEHSRFRVNAELAEFYRCGRDGAPDADMLARARARGDTALVFITRHSGEMLDNRPAPGQYYLTDGERAMLRAARETFDRVVLVLNTGYPIEMGWLRTCPVDAILYAGFAGMLASYALVELLDGRANPSGCLPDTWPWDYRDNPVSRNWPTLEAGAPTPREDAMGVRVYYEEDVYVGYRYFDTFGVPAAFSFGHGLSYTRFQVVPTGLRRTDAGVRVTVAVANVGARPGKRVVQLYAAAPAGRLEKPRRALVGFEKTALLAPGERQELVLEAALEDMASFDEARGAWVLEAGEYLLSVGCGLDDQAPCGGLALEETVLARVERLGGPVEPIHRLTRAVPEVRGGQSGLFGLEARFAVAAPRPDWRPEPLPPHRGGRVLWRDVQADPARLDAFVAQLPLSALCRLNVCAGHRWAPWRDGAAGYTARLRRYGLPSFSVSDANAGLNLKAPNIGFPASSVVAATFNRELARTVGRVIAAESREHGVCLNLGPGMNLHRSLLCGRHPEYFSEDPFLTGVMAGWHGRGLEEGGVGCCYKHLFCNNAELSRKGSHSVVSEQALRELYFRSFAIAFRVQSPSAVMTSYNALNGIYPAENPALLQGLLREEWGFRGFVMTDWGTYATVDLARMVGAGNCWITPGGWRWYRRLRRAARRGEVGRAALEHNARWLLRTFLRLETDNGASPARVSAPKTRC